MNTVTKGACPFRRQKRDHLILNGLNPLRDLRLQALLRDLGDLLFIGDAQLAQLVRNVRTDLLTADVHKGRKMRERNALPAVLVGGNLRNDLRGNVARRRERMRLLNERTRNDRAVLQHVLKIDQVAVVHVLRKIVGIMEMNEALVMRLHDVARQKNTAREILGDFPRHIVALHGVHRGILVGIFLLDFLVVALDEREDLRIRRVRLTNKRTRIAICDILARNRKRLLVHDLVFHEVLDLLHVDRAG